MMAMDLAKRGSYNRESKEWVQSEGHKACVTLLEEPMKQVRRGRSVIIVPTQHPTHTLMHLTGYTTWLTPE